MTIRRPTRTSVNLIAAASAVFIVQALAWPLGRGRLKDVDLRLYLDFWNRDFPALGSRAPIPGFFFGTLLSHLGGVGTEIVMGVCFVLAIWCIYRSGALWSPWIGVGLAATFLCHSFYGSIFHKLDSDGLFAAAYAAWMYFSLKNAHVQTPKLYALHGLFFVGLMMIRPANQIFILFSVYPLLFGAAPLTRRIMNAATYVGTAVVLLLAWFAFNSAWYGEFGISRFSNAHPLYHILMMPGHEIKPENGPATAALAASVNEDLLSGGSYKGRGIGSTRFFAEGGAAGWEELVALSDRKWGWDSKYRVLRDTAVEYIARNPGEWVLGVSKTMIHSFIMLYRVPASPPLGAIAETRLATDTAQPSRLILSTRGGQWTTTPDGRYYDGGRRDRLQQLQARYDAFVANFFVHRGGIPAVATVLNTTGNLFAPMILAVTVGLLGISFLGTGGPTAPAEHVLAILFLMALGVLGLSYALTESVVEYRFPFDPVFCLTAVVSARALVRSRRELVQRAGAMYSYASSR